MLKMLSNEELNALFGNPIKKEQKNTSLFEGNDMAAGEILSMEEVEQLLGGMGRETPPSPPQFKFETQEQESVIERLDKDVMKKLQLMYDGLARRFAARISKMLQSVADVRFMSVAQLYYSEFVFGCDNPSCFNLLHVESPSKDIHDGNMILDISPTIVPPMIERMLGGGREPSMTARRPLTNIEWKLIQRIIDEFLCELHVVWKDVADMKCTVAQQESNPQMITGIKPNGASLTVRWDSEVSGLGGTVCYNNRLSRHPFTSYPTMSQKQ